MKTTKDLVESLISSKMKDAVINEMIKAVEAEVDDSNEIRKAVKQAVAEYVASQEFKNEMKKEISRYITEEVDWYDDIDLTPVYKAFDGFLKEKMGTNDKPKRVVTSHKIG